MRRWLLLAIIVPLLARPTLAARFTGRAAVYYDRGHYWIELEIDTTGAVPLSDIDEPSSYAIIPRADDEPRFSPSSVRISKENGRFLYAVLGSSRIRGGRCYGVVFDPGAGRGHAIDGICDPMIEPRRGDRTLGERLFEDWVAPAFSAAGEEYRLNRLSAAYDLEGERAVTELAIEPVVELKSLSVTPHFSFDKVTYTGGTGGNATRREAGLDASAHAWIGGIRYRLEGGYSFRKDVRDRASLPDARSRELAVLFSVRVDNLFDGINRHGASVFKGIDLGMGWAWSDSSGSGGFTREVSSPIAIGRITWTLLSGLQLSYAAEVAGTDRFDGDFRAMHRFRARLLLSDALPAGRYRGYHPDLEFSLDAGRRPPFFLQERSISLGFTFDLYPW